MKTLICPMKTKGKAFHVHDNLIGYSATQFCVFAGVSYSRMNVVTLGKYSGFIICWLPIFPLKSDL